MYRNEKITIEKNNNRNLVKTCKNIDSILRSEIKLLILMEKILKPKLKKLQRASVFF